MPNPELAIATIKNKLIQNITVMLYYYSLNSTSQRLTTDYQHLSVLLPPHSVLLAFHSLTSTLCSVLLAPHLVSLGAQQCHLLVGGILTQSLQEHPSFWDSHPHNYFSQSKLIGLHFDGLGEFTLALDNITTGVGGYTNLKM